MSDKIAKTDAIEVLANQSWITTEVVKPPIAQPNVLPVFPRGYQLAEDWSEGVGYGHRTMIPKGFLCDLTSTPRFLWSFVPPDGMYRREALLHDFLYARKGALDYDAPNWTSAPWEQMDRLSVDARFRDGLMETARMSQSMACAFFVAVRLGGWLPWKRSTGVPRIEPLRYTVS